MALTPIDQSIANLSVAALTRRWPFVRQAQATDYVRTYQPVTFTDSLALAWVTAQASWTQVKLALAARYQVDGKVDSAVAEYRGLIRDQPWTQSGFEFAARALIAAGKSSEAAPYLEKAYAVEPTAWSCYQLGVLAERDTASMPRAVAMLQQSLAFAPNQPETLIELARVDLSVHDTTGARRVAAKLKRVNPNFPGLDKLLVRLGS
jgi:predicted Zn-dependent protease